MFSSFNSFPYDSGIGVVGVYFGIGFAAFSFIAVVLIEALVMKLYFETTVRPGTFLLKYIPLPFIQRLKYSFVINTISTLAGLPLAYFALGDVEINDFLLWLAGAFLLTLVVEFISLILIVRPRPAWGDALRFTLVSNLASYMALAITSLILHFQLWWIVWPSIAIAVLFRR